MNIKVRDILKELKKKGVTKDNIICIFREGSSIYLDHYNDLDFKVVVKEMPDGNGAYFPTTIKGQNVEFVYVTVPMWNNIMNRQAAYFLAECLDYELIYGDDSGFKRYDVFNDKKVQKYLVDIYDRYLFNFKDDGIAFPFSEKRIWNFLLFYFYWINERNVLSDKQREELQKAHDGVTNIDKYRSQFEFMKGEIL